MHEQLQDTDWLRRKYVTELKTMQEIADIVGCSKAAVSRALKRHGIETRPHTSKYPLLNDKEWLRKVYVEDGMSTYQIAKVAGTTPGNVVSHLETLGIGRRTSSEGLRLKFPRGRTMENHPRWKGGRRRTISGYLWRYVPDHPNASGHGYVQEHRLVAEEMLGRYLEADEVVHHIDDDRQNNDPSNLLVMSRGDHFRLHYNSYHDLLEARARITQLEAEVASLRAELARCRESS